MLAWRKDWNKFAYEVLGSRLDQEQRDIVDSVQHNKMTAVASGTARGKDYVSAVTCLCFLYLTPVFKDGKLIANTKVAMTAPTDRQVKNIMVPEIRRLLRNAPFLPGILTGHDIRTQYEEWYLTGFKASSDNTEAWSGFHAVNTMFAVTEASGISQTTFNAIEGNLQGNSRLLLVFNPNVTSGYAADAMKSDRFSKFRLSSLKAENVVSKKIVIPGQVDYDWVLDKVKTWCTPILDTDFNEGEGDFHWEGGIYRPNDLFRVKVLGMFPKASEDALIPYEWIELANNRWLEMKNDGFIPQKACRLGVDVAGMGRDSSILVPRYGNFVSEFIAHQSAGRADHMHVAGLMTKFVRIPTTKAFIDTIGEGAGVYSRMQELGHKNTFSCKFSEGAAKLHDITNEYTFANMRAYCYWALRDWLDPKNGFYPALPPCEQFMEEATCIKWNFTSAGDIQIEKKDDIKKKIKRSPDYIDALANTFYPHDDSGISSSQLLNKLL